MLVCCRCEKFVVGVVEWESKFENILFCFYGKGVWLWCFGGRVKLDIVNFCGFVGFFQFYQFIVDGFQQGWFVFFYVYVNFFFVEQVGQNFKFGFIWCFCQQIGEDGVVLGDGLDVVVVQGGQGQWNIVIGEDVSLWEMLVQGLFVGGVFYCVDVCFVVFIEFIWRVGWYEELLVGDEIWC